VGEGGDGTVEKPGRAEDDRTLGGYFAVHSRPPAFEACDGQPYTVSIETERSPDLRAPVAGYLLFPRWAETGVGIVGHVATPLLWRGPTKEAVVEAAGAASLRAVQRLLNEAVLRESASALAGGESDGADLGDSRGDDGGSDESGEGTGISDANGAGSAAP